MSERDKSLSDGDTGEYPVVWREQLDGLVAEVVDEEYVEPYMSPRDCDGNLGTMVCWHPDYILGDEQFTNGDGRGAVENRVERDDFKSMRHLARYLGIVKRAVCIVPLYLYDHSGISMSAGEPNPFDNPRVRDDGFGRGLGWDSSMVGFIYTTRERVEELCGVGKDGGLYCPDDWDGTPEAWVAKQLTNEVELYDRYLRGEVYFWRVVDADGKLIDSCGGYLPDVGVPCDAELDYAKQEARETLRAEVEERRNAAEAERVEAARCASIGIATIGG